MNERLRRSETLKGRFISTMRNEINNPLNAILALGEELEQGAIPPERHRAIGGLIASEASDLDFGIRNVFSAADLEAGERYPHLARVDVPSVLRGVQDSLRYQARKKDIAITLETSGPGITEFRTDPEALRSIAANLVSNAIKFSPDGGPVHVRARADERSLALEVEDQGIGIRPEEQALVFERFKQLESGPARLHPGQGLGLAVVRALVDLLEGSITLSSQPKKGTFLTCTLPRRGTTNHGEDACPDGNLFFFGETEAL
jgi:signal transduction histidine kinase